MPIYVVGFGFHVSSSSGYGKYWRDGEVSSKALMQQEIAGFIDTCT